MGGAMSSTGRRVVGYAEGGAGIGTLMLVLALAVGSDGCGSSPRKGRGGASVVPRSGHATPGTVGAITGADEIVDEYRYRLAPGDVIDVKFPYHPEDNERVLVRPDGRIGLQVIGNTMAAGLTVKELEQVVLEKSSVFLRDPVVSIVLAQLAEHKVYVGGQVAKPGYVLYREGMTPLQAVVERGGFIDDANTDEVLHISRVGDQVQSQRLDLEAVMDGDSSERVIMSPDDVIIVPRTFIGEADVWVDQWIRGLLPTVPRPGLDLNALAF